MFKKVLIVALVFSGCMWSPVWAPSEGGLSFEREHVFAGIALSYVCGVLPEKLDEVYILSSEDMQKLKDTSASSLPVKKIKARIAKDLPTAILFKVFDDESQSFVFEMACSSLKKKVIRYKVYGTQEKMPQHVFECLQHSFGVKKTMSAGLKVGLGVAGVGAVAATVWGCGLIGGAEPRRSYNWTPEQHKNLFRWDTAEGTKPLNDPQDMGIVVADEINKRFGSKILAVPHFSQNIYLLEDLFSCERLPEVIDWIKAQSKDVVLVISYNSLVESRGGTLFVPGGTCERTPDFIAQIPDFLKSSTKFRILFVGDPKQHRDRRIQPYFSGCGCLFDPEGFGETRDPASIDACMNRIKGLLKL